MKHGVVAAVLLSGIALQAAPVVFRNTAPGVGYVGSKVCAACHRQIYEKYTRTAMGQSITLPAASLVESAITIHSEELDRDFSVLREGRDLYQIESQKSAGKPVFESKHKLEYAIGSGENGISFLVRRGAYLFQAPLSYYTKTRQWDLSPGFEKADQGFSRPVYDACITCHAGRPQVVPQRDGLYREPPFLEMAIGCENCHGPGQLHVAERGHGLRSRLDTSIVNPARLAPRLAEDICMKCHQGGDVRVLLPGKQYADFHPGTPLLQTVAIVSLPLSSSRPDLLDHHVSMKLSACFRMSKGKLSCLTCHDPHEQPGPAAASEYYRARCLTCHSETSCGVPVSVRKSQTPADNCIGCHMPKRDIVKVSHSALTSHRILAKPEEPVDLSLPNAAPATSNTTRSAFNTARSASDATRSLPNAAHSLLDAATTPDLPGLLLLNSHPNAPALPVVTRLAIYGELLDRDARFLPKYLELLDKARLTDGADPVVLAALGRRALRQMSAQASDYLSRATADGSGSAATFVDLGEALHQAGKPEESAAALERGKALFPYSKEIRKSLILSYIRLKHYDQAQQSMEQYVADFPEDSFVRGLLDRVRNNGLQR